MTEDFDTIIEQIQALRRRGLGGERAAYAQGQAMVAAAMDAVTGADRARILCQKAQLARDLGQVDEALTAYDEAVAIWRKAANGQGLAYALRHMADIQVGEGRAEAALPFIDEALGLLSTADVLTRANALRVKALALEGLGRPAREAWAEARALYAEAGVDAGAAECDRHL